jgi:hypothetical protein
MCRRPSLTRDNRATLAQMCRRLSLILSGNGNVRLSALHAQEWPPSFAVTRRWHRPHNDWRFPGPSPAPRPST